MEYMSGGPTKVEFLGHRDTNQQAAPCVLNYWRSSHYGGAEVNVAAGEQWTKVVGPFFIYANSGSDPKTIYADAKSRASIEADKWPYQWVELANYPKLDKRSKVTGRLILNDFNSNNSFTNLVVGLTAPALSLSSTQIFSKGYGLTGSVMLNSINFGQMDRSMVLLC